MTLGAKLAVVLVAFVTILVVVIWMAFRERKAGHSIAADDFEAQQASDARVLAVIFTAIVAYIVFL